MEMRIDSVREEAPPLAPRLMVARMLWGALLVSTFIYVGVGAVIAQPGDTARILLPFLGAFAVALAVTSVLVPAMLLRAGLRRLKLPLEDVPDPKAEVFFREAPPSRRRFVSPDQARLRAFPLFQTSMILGLALAEAIALFGLVLRILGGSWPMAAGFFVVCWPLMIRHFPSVARLDRALERTYEASLR